MSSPDPSIPGGILLTSRQTGKLHLSNRSLTEIPASVLSINSTVSFSSGGSDGDNPDPAWFELVPITLLDLSFNSITIIPSSLDTSNFAEITSLYLMHNSLTGPGLPSSLASLPNLQLLRADHNQHLRGVVDLEDVNGLFERLVELSISWCGIERLPNGLLSLPALKRCNLAGNRLESLGAGETGTVLEELYVSENRLSVLGSLGGSMDGVFPKLRVLELQGNQITTLPAFWVLRYPSLQALDLRSNRLVDFVIANDSMSALDIHDHHLEQLFLSRNRLSSLPTHLRFLPRLVSLDLAQNQISQIGYSQFQGLSQLRRLDLSGNNLNDVPGTLGLLRQLTVVRLEGNPLRRMRRTIIGNTEELLEYLRKRIPEEHMPTAGPDRLLEGSTEVLSYCFDEALHSGKLILERKGLTELPERIIVTSLRDLVEIRCGENSLTVFQESILNRFKSSLMVLSLHKNTGLKEISDSVLAQCEVLSELDLSQCGLRELPIMALRQCHALTILNLSGNPDMSFSETDDSSFHASLSSGQSLSRLRELYLAFNKLRYVPAFVLHLGNSLELLDLSNNGIRVLLEDLPSSLRSLRTLMLQNNSLRTLPPLLGTMTTLQALRVEGNPIRTIRPAVLRGSTDGLLTYLRRQISFREGEEIERKKQQTRQQQTSNANAADDPVFTIAGRRRDRDRDRVEERHVEVDLTFEEEEMEEEEEIEIDQTFGARDRDRDRDRNYGRNRDESPSPPVQSLLTEEQFGQGLPGSVVSSSQLSSRMIPLERILSEEVENEDDSSPEPQPQPSPMSSRRFILDDMEEDDEEESTTRSASARVRRSANRNGRRGDGGRQRRRAGQTASATGRRRRNRGGGGGGGGGGRQTSRRGRGGGGSVRRGRDGVSTTLTSRLLSMDQIISPGAYPPETDDGGPGLDSIPGEERDEGGLVSSPSDPPDYSRVSAVVDTNRGSLRGTRGRKRDLQEDERAIQSHRKDEEDRIASQLKARGVSSATRYALKKKLAVIRAERIKKRRKLGLL